MVFRHSPAVAPAHRTKYFPVVFILLDFRVAIKLLMVTIPKKNWKKVGLRPPNNRVDNKSSIKMIRFFISFIPLSFPFPETPFPLD